MLIAGMASHICIPALLLLSFILHAQKKDEIFALSLRDTEGKLVQLSEIRNFRATVIVMLSPECPICEKYTIKLRELQKEYKERGVTIYGVFPGRHFDLDTIRKFIRTYKLDFSALLDENYRLTRMLKATITPEVFVIDAEGGIIYSGMIDNWFYSLGRKRGLVTEFYLKDAIAAVLENNKPAVYRTKPIGCFIYGLED